MHSRTLRFAAAALLILPGIARAQRDKSNSGDQRDNPRHNGAGDDSQKIHNIIEVVTTIVDLAGLALGVHLHDMGASEGVVKAGVVAHDALPPSVRAQVRRLTAIFSPIMWDAGSPGWKKVSVADATMGLDIFVMQTLRQSGLVYDERTCNRVHELQAATGAAWVSSQRDSAAGDEYLEYISARGRTACAAVFNRELLGRGPQGTDPFSRIASRGERILDCVDSTASHKLEIRLFSSLQAVVHPDEQLPASLGYGYRTPQVQLMDPIQAWPDNGPIWTIRIMQLRTFEGPSRVQHEPLMLYYLIDSEGFLWLEPTDGIAVLPRLVGRCSA
ncbi:MAG: hypothetical protein JWM95_165 [Gemmatimonadetes bacterium]|nr:hypothetical protein [Gemmatimonadota bacterium]